MIRFFRQWLGSKGGATAIEYALIAAGIALAVAGFIFAFGDELFVFFEELTASLDGIL